MQAVSYGTYLRAGAGNSDELLESITATARALGAGNIRVWGGPRGIASSKATSNIWSTATEELKRLAAMAAPHAITLSLEFHADSLVDTAD